MPLSTLVSYLAVSLVAFAFFALVVYVQQHVQSKRVANALSLLTSLAGTLATAVADEVRTLKDPTKPGTWTSDDKAKIKARVLNDLKAFGGSAIEQFKQLNGVSTDSMDALLDRLVEQQVEVLRTKAAPMLAVLAPMEPPALPAPKEAPAPVVTPPATP